MQLIYAVNYEPIPLLIVASIWYLVVTTILSIGQYYVERHFGRGTARGLPDTPLQRLRRNLFSFRHATVEVPPEGPPRRRGAAMSRRRWSAPTASTSASAGSRC